MGSKTHCLDIEVSCTDSELNQHEPLRYGEMNVGACLGIFYKVYNLEHEGAFDGELLG